MPKRGDNFQNGYVPSLGDVVHLNWSPTIGTEMTGPHYGLVVSDTLFNLATGMVVIVPITTKVGKVSNFELIINTGKVNGAAILSGVRSVDYQSRDIQLEAIAPAATVVEANRRIRMIFP